ncbi:MAG: SDR family NAD(P)-dependent oxidoreductase [Actinomycetales bacterium]|nr:SDR family NAD(P)-dependent oxidoreductase [Actinomycetales bacterium]
MGYIGSDTVALVTGGSRGLGLAAARGIGLRGARVIVLGRDTSRVTAAAAQLVDGGVEAAPVVADVADPASLARAAEEVAHVGTPDVLVLSAGVMSAKMTRTMRTSPDEWQRVMSINLDGVFYSIEAFAQDLAKNRSGRVIAVSACLGRFTGPGTSGGLAPYRISKAGVNALVRNFAAEMQWGQRGVLVDAVCPGHCRTDMGGPDAPRSADEGADTIVWLADRDAMDGEGNVVPTGVLWEDRQIVPW